MGKKQEEAWLRGLNFDPAKHPNAKAVRGFLKQAPDGVNWRLYLSVDLSEYIEISDGDLLDAVSLATDSKPLAGTVVWIKGSATVRRVRVLSRQIQAEFLGGEISGSHLQETSTEILARGAVKPTIDTGQQCTTRCTSEYTLCEPCGSYGAKACIKALLRKRDWELDTENQ